MHPDPDFTPPTSTKRSIFDPADGVGAFNFLRMKNGIIMLAMVSQTFSVRMMMNILVDVLTWFFKAPTISDDLPDSDNNEQHVEVDHLYDADFEEVMTWALRKIGYLDSHEKMTRFCDWSIIYGLGKQDGHDIVNLSLGAITQHVARALPDLSAHGASVAAVNAVVQLYSKLPLDERCRGAASLLESNVVWVVTAPHIGYQQIFTATGYSAAGEKDGRRPAGRYATMNECNNVAAGMTTRDAKIYCWNELLHHEQKRLFRDREHWISNSTAFCDHIILCTK